jgi:hypothetical protein
MEFNGIGLHLGNLAQLSKAKTRSISAENFTGEKGKGGMSTDGISAWCARELGQGWKVSPAVKLKANETIVLADIEGPGIVQHMWMTCAPERWRSLILRMYWDGEEQPSVETPLGDFYCNGWCERSIVNSQPISVMAGGGMNSYWQMPFRKSARITIENLGAEIPQFFYQIDYALTEIPDNMAYFHAQWRRSNPLGYAEVHTLLDGVRGSGHYVGTYLAWQANNNGWWGEGEIKFYMDGDTDFPTICGTGTEDYVGGAWAFEQVQGEGYLPYTAPYLGFHQVCRQDGFAKVNERFGMYRWHILDPIRFESDLKVTIQALGWRSEGRYLPLRDDIASVAYWYQTEPHVPYAPMAGKNELEVI